MASTVVTEGIVVRYECNRVSLDEARISPQGFYYHLYFIVVNSS